MGSYSLPLDKRMPILQEKLAKNEYEKEKTEKDS